MTPQLRFIILVAGILFILSGLAEMGLGDRYGAWIPDDISIERVILLSAIVVALGGAGWAILRRRKPKDEGEE